MLPENWTVHRTCSKAARGRIQFGAWSMGWLQNDLRRVERGITAKNLPGGNILHLGLAESATLGQLGDARDSSGTVSRPGHDVW